MALLPNGKVAKLKVAEWHRCRSLLPNGIHSCLSPCKFIVNGSLRLSKKSSLPKTKIDFCISGFSAVVVVIFVVGFVVIEEVVASFVGAISVVSVTVVDVEFIVVVDKVVVIGQIGFGQSTQPLGQFI